MEVQDLLIDILQNKNPSLFLGAGFSLGAINKSKKELPHACHLAKELYDKFLFTCLSANEKAKLFDEEKKIYNLKHVCNIIELKNLTKERNLYLTNRFLGSHVQSKDYHYYLKEYPWHIIFSLNIDDLVENIYEQNISVQLLGGEDTKDFGAVSLVKLHGSVLRPELGYIFSDKEYNHYLTQDSWAINLFATEYFRNDIIFLGTEFQENDLQNIIDKFLDAGAITKAHHYFFVTPTINDAVMEMRINTINNFHHIKMTTEQFLNFIINEITIKNNQRNVIKSQGAIFFDEKKKSYKKSFLNTGSLYQGNIPDLDDFLGDWDIRYPNSDRWINDILSNEHHQIISLYGEPYSGKTCVMLRMALELYNNGFFVFSFSLSLNLDIIQYSRLILEFLATLNQGTKCIILAENMPHYYPNLKYIIENCPINISKLVFLVTANREEHQIKKYIFDNFNGFEQHFINYEINHAYAKNIYNKLAEKSHLGELLKYADSEKNIIKLIKKTNDIIEVLYIAQEGRKFSDHFAIWLNQTAQDFVYKRTFQILCFLGEMNISEVPIQFFLRVVANIGYRISFDIFKSKFGDYLIINDDYIKIRCLRIIKEHVLNGLEETDKYNVLLYSSKYCLPFIKEGSINTYSRIFQMLIKTKKLTQSKILQNDIILKLLTHLEDSARHLSYYWIQIGIANRNLDRFEEANNAFNKAADVRGILSYNVEHAQAKNYMTWGLWNITNNGNDVNDFFTRGKETMQSLIENSPSQYFVYSVHSYTDMMLKYYKTTKTIPSISEANYMIKILNKISEYNDDCYSSQILSNFKKFCNSHKINCSNLIYHDKKLDSDFIDIDDIGTE